MLTVSHNHRYWRPATRLEGKIMIYRVFLITAILLCCLHVGSVQCADGLSAGNPGSVTIPDAMPWISEHFESYIEQGKLAGMTTLVSRGGEVIHFRAYGRRVLEDGEPLPLDTLFRLYSMTKPVTSVAAMILWERGGFKLDDPVSIYLPEFEGLTVYSGINDKGELQGIPANREMTVRDLMRHTSGLTYQFFTDSPVAHKYAETGVLDRTASTQIMVERLADIPLVLNPGEKWHYGMSTDVLGRLIEVIDGRPLDAFFRQEIFVPLEMNDTAFHVVAEKHGRLAQLVTINPSTGQLVSFPAPMASEHLEPAGLFSGGGGLVASTGDYWRFAQMLLDGGEFNGRRILAAKTIAMMTGNQLPAGENSTLPWDSSLGFGLGFAVKLQQGESMEPGPGPGSFYWDGSANTLFWVDPGQGLVAILMTNILPQNVWPLRTEFEKLVYRRP